MLAICIVKQGRESSPHDEPNQIIATHPSLILFGASAPHAQRPLSPLDAHQRPIFVRANRFDVSRECLISAYLNQQLIGIGGLSVDPCAETPRVEP